ncbi:MAG TPA: heavy metal-associated domain-containing protein [Acidocella sp.]|jgi:copper chaperone CopZ|nr:heavy metal-associated domain-containing protein [Acidocella sp.]
MSTTQTQIFLVPDMDCQSCIRAITDAVRRLDSSAQITAELAAKRVQISGTGDFAAAIESAGFTASPAQ